MGRPRLVLIAAVLAAAACFPVSAQTVVSTHSGVLYFFEGSVFLANQRLAQKFGNFPDIGEGRELRTEQGRAEVLLTPGVFLRLDHNSAIRMISEQLSDTRVELLSGSAIVELNEIAPDTAVTVIYKDWYIRAPEAGVYRIDTDPEQVRVYKGQVNVSAGTGAPVTVKDDENLPLAQVLVPQPDPITGGDGFKAWAMNRSQAVSADNAIAQEIVDDPSQMDSSGLDTGGFTYFPLTGVPSLGISNPYGVSFWSPYQATLNSLYFPSYLYTPFYPGWPSGIMIYPRPGLLLPGRIGSTGLRYGGTGLRTGTGIGRTLITPRPVTMPRPAIRPMMPAGGAHPGIRR
ncbi:MAG TPA: hypothetical protein VMG40_13625 [Bryobacteraceae bacterium]|nr:hypothetical protein [Bryobacteraceae bacterium]